MIKNSWSHLTYEKRCQISALLQVGKSNREIAKIVGVSHTTINRELFERRKKYAPFLMHKKAQIKKSKTQSRPSKFKGEVLDYTIKKLVYHQWSPEQITGRLKLEKKKFIVSHTTIYRHIRKDTKNGGFLYKNLRRKNKKYTCKGQRTVIQERIGIKQRPLIVDQKARIGDFEADTIIGKDHKGAIITLVDRKSKLLRLALLPNKNSEGTASSMIEKLKIFKPNSLHTITSDNGTEFAQHKRIAKALNIDFYFARPYKSCDRGLNENTNGLIRQYFPKKTDFTKLYPEQLKGVELALNSRPRKLLGFNTPLEVFFRELSGF